MFFEAPPHLRASCQFHVNFLDGDVLEIPATETDQAEHGDHARDTILCNPAKRSGVQAARTVLPEGRPQLGLQASLRSVSRKLF